MGLSVYLCSVSHWGRAPAQSFAQTLVSLGWRDAFIGWWPGVVHLSTWQPAWMWTGCQMLTVLSDININIYINIIAAVIFYSTCFIQLGLFDA